MARTDIYTAKNHRTSSGKEQKHTQGTKEHTEASDRFRVGVWVISIKKVLEASLRRGCLSTDRESSQMKAMQARVGCPPGKLSIGEAKGNSRWEIITGYSTDTRHSCNTPMHDGDSGESTEEKD